MTNEEVVQYLADGRSVKEISEITGVKVRTIEGKIARMKYRTFSFTAAQLVANYLRKGLIK